jgi:hypothetical protein
MKIVTGIFVSMFFGFVILFPVTMMGPYSSLPLPVFLLFFLGGLAGIITTIYLLLPKN